MRDITSNIQRVHLGNLALSGTTPATSAYVDMQGFNACDIVVVNNTITDAGTVDGFTVTLQESADTTGAGAATVAVAQTVGGNTVQVTDDTADDSVAGSMGYLGGSRYVGVSAVGTTGTNADISVFAIMGKPSVAPTVAVGTAVART